MKLKTMLAACAAILSLTACEEFNGRLTIYSNMPLNKASAGATALAKGDYPAKIKIQSKKKITLVVDTPSGKVSIPFKSNQDLSSLRAGQRVRLLPEVTGQPYVTEAFYDEKSSRSEIHDEIETCSENEEVLGFYKDDNGNEVSGWHTVTHSGYRKVKYYYEYTAGALNLEFQKNGTVMGKLSGRNSKTDKNYIETGSCVY